MPDDRDRTDPMAKRAPRRNISHGSSAPPGPMASLANIVAPPVPVVPVDDVDVQLLRLLSGDARLSQRALSRETSLSPPAIGERVARLERLGVIRGYTVDIDWAALGYAMAVHMTMTTAPGADLGDIVAELRRMPELDHVHIVTGEWDIVSRFRLRDQAHLQQLLLGDIWQVPGVHRVETSLELMRFDGDGPLAGE